MKKHKKQEVTEIINKVTMIRRKILNMFDISEDILRTHINSQFVQLTNMLLDLNRICNGIVREIWTEDKNMKTLMEQEINLTRDIDKCRNLGQELKNHRYPEDIPQKAQEISEHIEELSILLFGEC